jgi:hypothetical protein
VTVEAGGVLAPGASLGAGTFEGDLTLEDGAVYDWEYGFGDQADSLTVEGSLLVPGPTGNAVVRLYDVGAEGPPEGDYVLIEYGSGEPVLGTWTVLGLDTGWSWGEIVHDTDNNQILLRFRMPKPTSVIIK